MSLVRHSRLARSPRGSIAGRRLSRIAGVLAAVIVAVSVGLVTSAQAADPAWTVTQIGQPGFWPLDVNGEGVVAGYVGSYPDYHAVVWSNGTTTALDTPENTVRSAASAINNLGQMVGSVTLRLASGERSEAVLWGADGGYTLLGFLDNGTFSQALDINDLGQVVGAASPAGGTYTAVLWEGNGPEALPVPAGPPCPPGGCGFMTTTSFANAINNQGEIAGTISYPYQPQNAVLWRPDAAPVFLPPLSAGRGAGAFDINDAGEIVGNGILMTGPPFHPIAWIDGQPTDLGTLGGWGGAAAINSEGVIVGSLTDTGGLQHAYVWEELVGIPLPLLPGDVEGQTGGVNASGQIIGVSRSPTGTWRAAMWSKQSDTTPPVITVPAEITRDATTPAGTTVEFTASATDENPTSPAVTCAPPSGSVYPIGVTTVNCHATDNAGNIGAASFTVTVRGAAEQLATLLDDVQGVGPGTSLADKVMAAQAAYTASDPARAGEVLNAFINQVKALSGKGITDLGTADALIADATRIQAVLGG